MRWIGTFSLALLLAAAPARGEVSAEKVELIRQLVVVTGAAELGNQITATMILQMKPSFPTVPDSLWQELAKELDMQGFLDAVSVPLYDRHFTTEDLRGLLAFYETPLGKKLLAVTPAIAQESMLLGGQWGQRRAEELIERLEARGYQHQL